MLMQYGQFLDHDITLTPINKGFPDSILDCRSCDAAQTVHPECWPIPVPKNDPYFPALNTTSGQWLNREKINGQLILFSLFYRAVGTWWQGSSCHTIFEKFTVVCHNLPYIAIFLRFTLPCHTNILRLPTALWILACWHVHILIFIHIGNNNAISFDLTPWIPYCLKGWEIQILNAKPQQIFYFYRLYFSL